MTPSKYLAALMLFAVTPGWAACAGDSERDDAQTARDDESSDDEGSDDGQDDSDDESSDDDSSDDGQKGSDAGSGSSGGDGGEEPGQSDDSTGGGDDDLTDGSDDAPLTDDEISEGSHELEVCSSVSLDDAGNLLYSRCEVSDSGEGSCSCDAPFGESADPISVVDVASCDETLQAECGVTELDRLTCSMEDYGACAPLSEEAEQWRCLCDGEREVTPVDADSCRAAGFAACSDSCESSAGRCTPGMDPLTYECACELYGSRTVSWDGYGCTEVLENTCEPGHGLHQWGSCINEMGYCDQPDGGEPTWACQCLDGSSQTVTLDFSEDEDDDVEPDCGVALLRVCGEYEPPEGDTCERTTQAGRASCERERSGDPDAPEGELAFVCNCSFECGDGAGASGGSQTAASCEQAMDLACGQAGPTCD